MCADDSPPLDIVPCFGRSSKGGRADVQKTAPLRSQNTGSAHRRRELSVASQRQASTESVGGMIKKIYEVYPLHCAQWGAEMKIISFIERDQSKVIRLRQGFGGTG